MAELHDPVILLGLFLVLTSVNLGLMFRFIYKVLTLKSMR